MTKERGSEKLLPQLFADPHVSPEALGKAVSEAKAAGFRFDRLWWKGQPAIDLIKATVRVEPSLLGETVARFAGLNSAQQTVNLDVFPLGTPRPGEFQVGVEINRTISKMPG